MIRKEKIFKLPVIIFTLTPRLRALRIVSALSCLGGSKRGNNPTNCQGPPGLSLVASGTSCETNKRIHTKYNKFLEPPKEKTQKEA